MFSSNFLSFIFYILLTTVCGRCVSIVWEGIHNPPKDGRCNRGPWPFNCSLFYFNLFPYLASTLVLNGIHCRGQRLLSSLSETIFSVAFTIIQPHHSVLQCTYNLVPRFSNCNLFLLVHKAPEWFKSRSQGFWLDFEFYSRRHLQDAPHVLVFVLQVQLAIF